MDIEITNIVTEPLEAAIYLHVPGRPHDFTLRVLADWLREHNLPAHVIALEKLQTTDSGALWKVLLPAPIWPRYSRASTAYGIQQAKPGLYIGLSHGFVSDAARQEATDKGVWGESGPMMGPLLNVHRAYDAHYDIEFLNGETASIYGFPYAHAELNYGHDDETMDCIEFQGMFYGDIDIFIVSDKTGKE